MRKDLVTEQILIPAGVVGRTKNYFSVYPKFPVLLPVVGVRVSIMIADLIGFSPAQKLFLKAFGKMPHRVFVISEAWRKRVEGLVGRDVVRVYADLHYMDEMFRARKTKSSTTLPAGIVPGKYLLYVGNFNPHKNILRLLLAFRIAQEKNREIQLVLAGGGGRKEVPLFHPTGCKIIISPDDELLGELYRNSFAVIAPSLSEGLGIPPLEACYFGKAVLASDIDVFRETVGQCAVFFDPKSETDMAEKILLVYRNERLRRELENRSRETAKFFLSFKAGEMIYEHILY